MEKISGSNCLDISAMVLMKMLKLDGKSHIWLVNNTPTTVLPSDEHMTVYNLVNSYFPGQLNAPGPSTMVSEEAEYEDGPSKKDLAHIL